MLLRAVMILSWVLMHNALGASSSFGGARAGGFSGGRSFSAPAARSFSSPAVSSPRAAGGSYFGGSRSSGSAATITRPVYPTPAPKPSVGGSAGKPVPSRTVIRETHVHHATPAPSHDGFFTGFLFGNLLHQQQPAPVIVSTGAPAAAVSATPPAPTPAVTATAEEGTSWFHVLARVLFWLIALSAIAATVAYCVFGRRPLW